MYSLLIKNAKIIDGSGQAAEEALWDVAIEKDRIVNITKNLQTAAYQTIDIGGKVLAPGFVDIQNHSDTYWQLFENPSLDSLITQGFTTILVGQCGASLAPILSQSSLLPVQKWHNLEGANLNWSTFGEYLKELSTKKYGANIASLVGYATLRRGLVGDEVRGLEPPEIESLKKVLLKSLSEGAFGLSTGLSYAHEIIISQLEIFELAKLVASNNALFSVHLRSEGSEILESVEEVLEIAKNSGVNILLSHLKVKNEENWPKGNQVLEALETAYHRGINVHFNAYPYDTIWQVLYSYLPKWAIEGGRKLMLKGFSDKVQRNKILAYLNSQSIKWPSVLITASSGKLGYVGKTIGQVAKNLEISSEAAVLHILENGGSEIMVLEKALEENFVERLLTHPLGFVATDGGGFSLDHKGKLVHPRCFGTAPKFLSSVIKSKKISLEKAINKLTLGPASKLGLAGRGQIKINNFADLVVIDPSKIESLANYQNPFQFTKGLDYVFVNGTPAVFEGKLTGQLNGQVLRRK